jgi:hypothetical protein
MNEDPKHGYVRILVHTEVVDGYPPEEWEGVWAVPLAPGRYRIDNIPFYAKNLSCDDVVEVTQSGDAYIFEAVVEPSENSTIRVIIYDLADEDEVRAELIKRGCSIEGTGTAGLIALNVPKASLEDVAAYLEEQFAGERLDFEEGALR